MFAKRKMEIFAKRLKSILNSTITLENLQKWLRRILTSRDQVGAMYTTMETCTTTSLMENSMMRVDSAICTTNTLICLRKRLVTDRSCSHTLLKRAFERLALNLQINL